MINLSACDVEGGYEYPFSVMKKEQRFGNLGGAFDILEYSYPGLLKEIICLITIYYIILACGIYSLQSPKNRESERIFAPDMAIFYCSREDWQSFQKFASD
ncbi:MAG: hypothetical protein J6W00_09570 [Lentisphaeria bacterium]|nr:hypothetical protein [Lentisphaeria bacterium]